MSGRSIRTLIYVALILALPLHSDFWLWNDSRRVLGLPVGLLYHVGFCLAMSVLMALLVRFAWPVLGEPDEAER